VTVPRVRVVAALLRKGDSVLVQQRRSGGARGLLWELPGGKVEPGETDAEALARECREELGIEIAVEEAAFSGAHRYSDLEMTLVLYRCRHLSGAPRPLCAHAVRFEPVGRLKALPFCEADLPLIELLSRGEL
jgi:8-oxo-dGTP diphosphatase